MSIPLALSVVGDEQVLHKADCLRLGIWPHGPLYGQDELLAPLSLQNVRSRSGSVRREDRELRDDPRINRAFRPLRYGYEIDDLAMDFGVPLPEALISPIQPFAFRQYPCLPLLSHDVSPSKPRLQYSAGSKIQVDERSASVITQSLSPALVW